MPRYEDKDVSFDVPRDWVDRSIVAFSLPIRPGQPTAPNIVMTRDQLLPGETLDAYSDRQLVELARRIDNFNLLRKSEITVNDLPAIELRFGWKGRQGPLEQRLVFAVLSGGRVFTFNATMIKSDASRLNPIFDRIVAGIKWTSFGA